MQENFNVFFEPFIVLGPHTLMPWTITNVRIWSKSRMISLIDSSRGQSEVWGLYKYRYLNNASTVCDEIFTVYTQDNADYYDVNLFSNLHPIRKNLPPNLN